MLLFKGDDYLPPKLIFKKEDVLNVAYEIVRKEGFANLNARRIASEMNSSVHPIFRHFSDMEDLKKAVYEKIFEKYHEYMFSGENKPRPYKEMGMSYIRFAKDYPEFFKIIFMNHGKIVPENLFTSDKKLYESILKNVGEVTEISEEDGVRNFHLKIWIFTHGIATLLATETCDISEEQVSQMLTEEFRALMLLEKGDNKNEK